MPSKAQESSVPALNDDVLRMLQDDFERSIKEGGFELPRIEVIHPSQLFQMPDGNTVRTIQGIYLGEQRFNIKFPTNTPEGEKVPPECFASDGIHTDKPREKFRTPEGHDLAVFGACKGCYFNMFGSGKEGTGKACAAKATMLILPLSYDSDCIVPYALTLSTSSMRSPRGGGEMTSLVRLTIGQLMPVSKLPPAGFLVELALERKTKGAQTYSVLGAKVLGSLKDGKLEVAQYRMASAMANQWLPKLKGASVEEVLGADDDDDPNTAHVVVGRVMRETVNDGLPF